MGVELSGGTGVVSFVVNNLRPPTITTGGLQSSGNGEIGHHLMQSLAPHNIHKVCFRKNSSKGRPGWGFSLGADFEQVWLNLASRPAAGGGQVGRVSCSLAGKRWPGPSMAMWQGHEAGTGRAMRGMV